jgi:hypothetical protein
MRLVGQGVDVEYHRARDLTLLDLADEEDRALGGHGTLYPRPEGFGVRGRERVKESRSRRRP